MTTLGLLGPLHARQMVSIDRPAFNMRSGPGTQYSATWQLARGHPLAVTGRKGSWLELRDIASDEGWVYRPPVGVPPRR
jgi:SH3-like domain-containing protein